MQHASVLTCLSANENWSGRVAIMIPVSIDHMPRPNSAVARQPLNQVQTAFQFDTSHERSLFASELSCPTVITVDQYGGTHKFGTRVSPETAIAHFIPAPLDNAFYYLQAR
jgi:hypothetical protein